MRKDDAMTAWPKDELLRIAETDDLHISPFRVDGKTYGTPTWIWPVAVDDGLYVRSYNDRYDLSLDRPQPDDRDAVLH